MKNKGILIVIILGIIGLLAFLVGYRLWNKPHTDVAGSHAIRVDAATLYDLFVNDSSTARSRYQEQVLEVKGVVQKQETNQQQQSVVMLNTNQSGAFINCTFELETPKLDSGSTATIKGICKGIGAGDADMGILGDVYLVRCQPVK